MKMGNGVLTDAHIYLVGICAMTAGELVKWAHETLAGTPQGFWWGDYT